MRTDPSVFPPNPQPPVTLAIRSAFLLLLLFLGRFPRTGRVWAPLLRPLLLSRAGVWGLWRTTAKDDSYLLQSSQDTPLKTPVVWWSGASFSEGPCRHLWFCPGRFVYPAGGRQDVSPQETGLLQGVDCARSPSSEIFSSEGSRGFTCQDPAPLG